MRPRHAVDHFRQQGAGGAGEAQRVALRTVGAEAVQHRVAAAQIPLHGQRVFKIAPVGEGGFLVGRRETGELRQGRGVHVLGVVGVGQVLELHLPVGIHQHAVATGGKLDFTVRRQVAVARQIGRRVAQVILETDAVPGQAGEDEAAVRTQARHFDQVLVRSGRALAPAGRVGRLAQGAGVVEHPAVVGAAKEFGSAPLALADGVAAMRAAVQQHAQL